METINSYDGWIGTDAYDVNGDKIGEIDAIYYDDQTGRPEWMAIRTGFFGMNTSFAPIAGGTVRDGKLHLPYTKDQVKDAPNVAPNGHLTADEERDLFDHYGFAWDARSYGVGERFDSEYDVTPADAHRGRGRRDDAFGGAAAGRYREGRHRQGPSAQVRRHRAPERHRAGDP